MTFLLVTAWVVVVGFWLMTTFYEANKKRDLEWKRNRAAELAAEREAERAGETA